MRQTQLSLLCPVCTQRAYLGPHAEIQSSEQFLVCFGGQLKGKAVSKQRMTNWIIAFAYQAQGVMCLLRVHLHSTRRVAFFWAQTLVMHNGPDVLLAHTTFSLPVVIMCTFMSI